MFVKSIEDNNYDSPIASGDSFRKNLSEQRRRHQGCLGSRATTASPNTLLGTPRLSRILTLALGAGPPRPRTGSLIRLTFHGWPPRLKFGGDAPGPNPSDSREVRQISVQKLSAVWVCPKIVRTLILGKMFRYV